MATLSNGEPRDKPSDRVLIVAALDRELSPLKRDVHPRLALLETGEGTTNAERAVETWLDCETPRAVLGIGFAGALSPSLAVGDLVVARESWMIGSNAVSATPTLLEAARRVRSERMETLFGISLTVDEIVCKAETKRSLAMTLATGELACVDMESWAVARACAERGVPCLIARCITDLFAEDLPVDFNRSRAADGRVNNWKVVASALTRPASIKGLWKLRRRSTVCSEQLATFVRRLSAEI